MGYTVLLTAAAERDLDEIYSYIAGHDQPEKAKKVTFQIGKAIASLAEYPERGVYPKELVALGMREFREVFFKPYRVIYRIKEKNVYIHVIADGRRDMRALLERRIFGI